MIFSKLEFVNGFCVIFCVNVLFIVKFVFIKVVFKICGNWIVWMIWCVWLVVLKCVNELIIVWIEIDVVLNINDRSIVFSSKKR